MSHAATPPNGKTPGDTRRTTKPGPASVFDVASVFTRLLPKQLKDEAQLAALELKDKGIKLGIGAAMAVAGLIFLGMAVIALIGAAIAGLSHVMPAWLAALLLALLFLIVLAVLALLAMGRIKSALPLKPERAIFGLRYDLGVVKEGSAYTEGRVHREINEQEQQKEREAEAAANDPKQVKPVKPTEEQLRQRLKLRREHLKGLRDDVQHRAESVQSSAQGFIDRTTRTFDRTKGGVKQSFATRGGSQGVRPQGSESAAERKQWLAVAAAAGSAFLYLMGRLFRK